MERAGATTMKGAPMTLVGPELKVGDAAAPEGASGGVRQVGSASGEAGSGGPRRRHGESRGVDVHVLLHRRAGDGLGIGEEVRYGAVWTVLPADAGGRGVSGAVAIRGGLCERGAHRRGYREDHRGGAGSA